jgi:hypothetical protein
MFAGPMLRHSMRSRLLQEAAYPAMDSVMIVGGEGEGCVSS